MRAPADFILLSCWVTLGVLCAEFRQGHDAWNKGCYCCLMLLVLFACGWLPHFPAHTIIIIITCGPPLPFPLHHVYPAPSPLTTRSGPIILRAAEAVFGHGGMPPMHPPSSFTLPPTRSGTNILKAAEAVLGHGGMPPMHQTLTAARQEQAGGKAGGGGGPWGRGSINNIDNDNSKCHLNQAGSSCGSGTRDPWLILRVGGSSSRGQQ